MADEKLKKKVYEVLKKGYFNGPDDAVDVSDGPEDSIYLVLVSRKFDGKRLKEKNNLIWSELMRHLQSVRWPNSFQSLNAPYKDTLPKNTSTLLSLNKSCTSLKSPLGELKYLGRRISFFRGSITPVKPWLTKRQCVC